MKGASACHRATREAKPSCVVCYEEAGTTCCGHAGHVACRSCWGKWVARCRDTGAALHCPVCRKPPCAGRVPRSIGISAASKHVYALGDGRVVMETAWYGGGRGTGIGFTSIMD